MFAGITLDDVGLKIPIEEKKNDYYSEVGMIKYMKQRFWCIAIGFCMILGVCGCGSSSDSSLADSAPAERRYCCF